MDEQRAPADVAALVEALEARARQAGAEGSTALLRGMLGSVAEMMHGVEDRLGRLEEALAGAGGGPGGAGAGAGGELAEQVQAGLAAFNARLGRLEEAFVRALREGEEGPEEAGVSVEQVRAWVDAAHRRQAESLAAVAASVQEVRAVLADGDRLGPVAGAVKALAERVEEAVEGSREEARGQVARLDERISALAAAVDDLRAVVEHQLEETANTLGRRATEAGRKLAADLGLRNRRSDADWRQ